MIVTFFDLMTGTTAKRAGIHPFELTDNNWECDCNRQMLFDKLEHRQGRGICEGYTRFIAIAVEREEEDPPFDPQDVLIEANASYYHALDAYDNQSHHQEPSHDSDAD